MIGKMLGRLSRRGTRTCDCCDHSRSKREWKRDEEKLWRVEEYEPDPRYVLLRTASGAQCVIPKEPLHFPDRDI